MKYITLLFFFLFSVGLFAQPRTVIMSGTPVSINNGQKIKFTNDNLIAEDDVAGTADTSLGLWDFWHYARLTAPIYTSDNYFSGIAVNSGTIAINNFPPLFPYATGGILLRRSGTANSGYSFLSSNAATQVTDVFGGISHKFRTQIDFKLLTGTEFQFGYSDKSAWNNGSVDGAFFSMINSVISVTTISNSATTTNANTYTVTTGVIYTFDVEINQAGTEARFRIYEGNNSTPVYDQINTTNIPTGSTRGFGANLWIYNSGTGITALACLYSYGIGTIAGFNKYN